MSILKTHPNTNITLLSWVHWSLNKAKTYSCQQGVFVVKQKRLTQLIMMETVSIVSQVKILLTGVPSLWKKCERGASHLQAYWRPLLGAKEM